MHTQAIGGPSAPQSAREALLLPPAPARRLPSPQLVGTPGEYVIEITVKGATGDTALAYEMGRVTALEGRALGIHIAYAPVLDVNNNPANPVINVRSFGEDPVRVARLSALFVHGALDGDAGQRDPRSASFPLPLC